MIAGLAILTFIFSAAVIITAALYYIISEFLNSAERLWYNEGWLRAILMSAAALTFSSLTTTMMLIFASSPIVTLSIAANLNPAIILIISGLCLSILGASLGSFAINSVYDFIEKKTHVRAIDPSDPYRFRITEDEEDILVEKYLDPIKVKCALVALRVEINCVLQNDNAIPSFLSRHLGHQKSKQVHSLLQNVRSLRRGELTEAIVGDLSFDCRAYEQPLSQHEHLGPYHSKDENIFSSVLTEDVPLPIAYLAASAPILQEKFVANESMIP
jgi:hypothetical protein